MVQGNLLSYEIVAFGIFYKFVYLSDVGMIYLLQYTDFIEHLLLLLLTHDILVHCLDYSPLFWIVLALDCANLSEVTVFQLFSNFIGVFEVALCFQVDEIRRFNLIFWNF